MNLNREWVARETLTEIKYWTDLSRTGNAEAGRRFARYLKFSGIGRFCGQETMDDIAALERAASVSTDPFGDILCRLTRLEESLTARRDAA